ncbi:MAG: presqualene diphosphate synthase HpnD [Gemmataceae bacterium]
MLSSHISRSYRICESIAKQRAGNFYIAFRVLPPDQRRAMCALYAFLRIADDLSDEPAPAQTKRTELQNWRRGLRECLAANPTHPIHLALQHTVERYSIPPAYLEAAIDGVEIDLEKVTYQTFTELRRYCFHVASVVGLSCIHIWGFENARAKEYAEKAGLAFQLTNILRDLGEDARLGRVYLPEEELQRFGCSADSLARGQRDENYRQLMQFQVSRARKFYEESWPLLPLLAPAGRAVFLVMARTYRAILERIEKRNYDVFAERVALTKWEKIGYALRALPVRWGLVDVT